MTDVVEIWEKPESKQIYMLAGWRQWADAGSTSSALPQYLIQQTGAQKIGRIRPDGFYLFQIPGTHDLVRPIVRFEDGYPETLETQRNDFYFTGDDQRGVVIFLGDEPHLDVERYIQALLSAARSLGVKRIIGFGGVYGELPYDKERMISCIYSQAHLKDEAKRLAVNFSDYHGGASIGSYLCRRAAESDMEYLSLYAFVPTYDFSNFIQIGSSIRIENDFMAWLGIMRRVNYMLKTTFDLTDLERKSKRLIELVDDKINELEGMSSQFSVREYMKRLSEEFNEMVFDPLDSVWEEELRRLFDDDESEPED
jgi:proteasome assembly chaperone (PAC2) family protein